MDEVARIAQRLALVRDAAKVIAEAPAGQLLLALAQLEFDTRGDPDFFYEVVADLLWRLDGHRELAVIRWLHRGFEG